MEMNVEASARLRERLAERSAPGVNPERHGSPSCLATIDKLLAMELKRVTFRDELMQAMRGEIERSGVTLPDYLRPGALPDKARESEDPIGTLVTLVELGYLLGVGVRANAPGALRETLRLMTPTAES
ncbi:hypothetical protein J2T57_001644 [Natronocella acetinitrilica]|uniref:Uncharacterized protein n=1 Tax=Natronocella acetinitrilica TaxID=414046 RepID=A0AAE3KFW9_9GAMM|nr:hypothetical protein [Natronocella acetinitrilica]MCP1674542.1 hypothetical protein [Natronocella acetinitrilica]